MAGNFNSPALGDGYSAFAQAVRDVVADMIKGLDPALSLGTTNIPTNAIRWNSASAVWEKYNGTTWAGLASSYAITVTGSAAKWTTGRTVTLTGDVTGISAAFDGAGNLSFAATLATVTAAKGGTGFTSYTIGDVLYANGASTLAKLSAVATGNALISGGAGAAPSWGKVGLTTHISGTLAIGNGGTGATTAGAARTALGSTTVGDAVFIAANAAAAQSALALVPGTNVQAYDANTSKLNVAQTYSAAQRGAVSALTDGVTITPDFAAANNFSVTLAGNRTLANPTNIVAGQSGVIAVTQDATGSRTLAFGTYYKSAGGAALSLSSTANAVDYLNYYVETTTRIFISVTRDVK